MKKLIQGVLIALAALAAILVVRAMSLTSKQIEVGAVETIAVDAAAAAGRLGGALRFKTISYQNPDDFDAAPFLGLHAYLEATYPGVHQNLARETVNDLSLLYRWQGSDDALEPVLLMGHMDVVPVEPGTEDKWEQAPFSGAIADGYIWGRGAIDDKGSVVATLEAVEALLELGFAPSRTIYLAFGHDEEIGGHRGAAKIAQLLAERGIHVAITIDEGMVITEGMVPGITAPVASVAIAEKGFVSLRLTSRAQGGHSSMPPKRTALGAISRAIAALERNQMPAVLSGPTAAMFDYLAPEMGFADRLLFANRWLFGPMIVSRLEQSPTSNALVRTTTAPTIIHGGIKENVLPSEIEAVVNFRIIPGETYDMVRDHAVRVIDDPDIEVEFMDIIFNNPSPVADVDSWSFAAIARSVREVFPEVIVAPGLVVGGTDTVHYADVSDAGYRFVPYVMGPEDFARFHGTNERLGVQNFAQVVKYFGQLIRNISAPAR